MACCDPLTSPVLCFPARYYECMNIAKRGFTVVELIIFVGSYPTNLPSTVQPTKGNVLHLATTDADSFCANGYGPSGEMMSIDVLGNPKSYLCGGALAGGMSYNASAGQVCTGTTSGSAKSPLVRVDGSTSARLTLEAYATQPPPSQTPNSAGYYSSSYFQADGVTPATNTGAVIVTRRLQR